MGGSCPRPGGILTFGMTPERETFALIPRTGNGRILHDEARTLSRRYRLKVRVRFSRPGTIYSQLVCGVPSPRLFPTGRGYIVHFHPAYLERLSPDGVRGALAHEFAHILLGHIDALKTDDHRFETQRDVHRAELAADAIATAMVGPKPLQEIFGAMRADHGESVMYPALRTRKRIVTRIANHLALE